MFLSEPNTNVLTLTRLSSVQEKRTPTTKLFGKSIFFLGRVEVQSSYVKIGHRFVESELEAIEAEEAGETQEEPEAALHVVVVRLSFAYRASTAGSYVIGTEIGLQ